MNMVRRSHQDRVDVLHFESTLVFANPEDPLSSHYLRPTLEGGKRLAYGARALTEGGYVGCGVPRSLATPVLRI